MDDYEDFVEDSIARADAAYNEYQGFLQDQAAKLDKCEDDIRVLESVIKTIPAMANIIRDAPKLLEMLQQKQEVRTQLRHTLGIDA